MKIAILAATLSAASAFTPSSVKRSSSPSLSMSSEAATNKPNDASKVTPINGWVPDSSKPCYGLPGVSEPLGFFDPAGFTMDKDLGEIKRLREAEVLHGRVAMMATVGYLIGESTPTLAYGSTIPHTIANNQIPEIPGYIMLPFFLAINLAEAWRSVIGWVEPNQKGPLFQLREKYYPGDYYFDRKYRMQSSLQ